MSYVKKYTVTIANASATGVVGVGYTTEIEMGHLAAFRVRDHGDNPLKTGTSATVLLRLTSTAGPIIGRSSSGIATALTDQFYYPRVPLNKSTAAATLYHSSEPDAGSAQTAMQPIADDPVYIMRSSPSSTAGSTEGVIVDLYIV